MKKYITTFALLFSIGAYAASDDAYTTLGLPGDNLNLSVVLDVFKQSASVSDFEKKLNDPAMRVNNLDLNNDGTVDYLKVTDYGKNDYHTIVIQDIISSTETQDVAVIDLQRNNGDMVHIQIVGDESLYGKNYVIEPQIENAAKQSQPTTIVNNNYYTYENPAPYVNAWSWPSVSFIFGPSYSPWVSPWHWTYYPTWWYARPRAYYNVYYSYYNNFGWNNYCRRNYVINQPRYHTYYNNRRVVSNTVQVNVTKNVYKNNPPRGNTYSNTNNGNLQNGQGKGNWKKENAAVNSTNPKANNPKWSKNNTNTGQGQNNPKSNNPKWTDNKPADGNQQGQTNPKNNGQWKNNTGSTNTNNGNGNWNNPKKDGDVTQPKPVNTNTGNGNWNNPNKPVNSSPKNNQGNWNNQPRQQQQNNKSSNNGGFKGNTNGSGGVKTGSRGK